MLNRFMKVLVIMSILLVSALFGNDTKDFTASTDVYEIHAPTKNDLATAKEDMDFAVQNFKKYFGADPPKIAVVIVNSPAETAKIQTGPFAKRNLRVLPFLSEAYFKSISIRGKILSHEACHMYFVSYVDKKMRDKNIKPDATRRVSSSGHPATPDWFDETVASLCETTSLQNSRLKSLQSNLDKAFSLKELFSMENPNVAAGKRALAEYNASRKMSGTGSPSVLTRRSRRPRGGFNKTSMFYSQSLYFSKFLTEKKGPLIVGKVAEGLIVGKNMKVILANIGILKSDLADLKKEWKTWVETYTF